MLIRRAALIKTSEITDPALYLRRRQFLGRAVVGASALLAPTLACHAETDDVAAGPAVDADPFHASDEVTPFEDATRYNNFYEFGTDKSDPKRNAGTLRTSPWPITIAGEVAKPATLDQRDLIGAHTVEERIYRLRCVEAWSMVIPWRGIPLGDILRRFEPTSNAKYVAFTTLLDPEQMPGQRRPILDWPYVEGLRMDEAMHPLTILATGMYGRDLPNQNGAPLRLVVPWKYGFKSIKSIVRIQLMRTQPPTSWNLSAPREYGFYANVNPAVDHPRWTQKRERRIGDFRKRATLPFNGYAEQVAHLYSGMDLRVNF